MWLRNLPLEAGLKALNIAPGLFRKKFGFESFADFDEQLWQELLTEAKIAKYRPEGVFWQRSRP